jgi:acyl-homoserine lactone acylase PvdQ
MDRRAFLKTVGVTAGAASVGFGIAATGTGPGRIVASESLTGDVDLLTDEQGVSHVYGENLHAVGYGQGSVQARDRLFQLDLLRSLGRGELSQIIGPGELSQDTSNTRTLYTDAELREQWESANDDTREMISGYTDGVNDRLDAMTARGELPGEYTLLGRKPRPWKPTDTIAAIAFTIGRFGVSGGGGMSELSTVGSLFDRVEGETPSAPDSFESRAEAWAAYGDINTVEVPEGHYGSIRAAELRQSAEEVPTGGAIPTGERALAYDEVPQAQLDLLAATELEDWGIEESALDGIPDLARVATGMFAGAGFGSNAIVVDGEHTETGDPMLGGGPQMGLFKPPIIHEVGLHGPDFDVAGVGVVGTPGIVVGHTPEFAWTVTTAGDPMTEHVAVELDPDDRYRYRWDGEFHEFVTEEFVHRPNLWAGLTEGETSPEQVRQEVAYVEQEGTRMPVVGYSPEENVAVVERVSTRMDELEGAFMWADIGRASNREEFEESLSEFPFGFNFHYVDDEGIAYYRTGRLPNRSNESDPRFPTPQEHHEWDGFEEGILVRETDPDRGYVVNWNNAAAPGWRNSSGEFRWEGHQRVDIMDRLTKEKILRTDNSRSVGDIGAASGERLPEEASGERLPEEASGNLALADVEEIIEDCSVEHPYAPPLIPHLVAAARASDDDRLHAVADELEAWAGTTALERWAGESTLARWVETEYPFRPGEDGRYPTGGMAIYEAVSRALTDQALGDLLGDGTPGYNFDPTSVETSGDPHAADHGSGAGGRVLLLDALDGDDRLSADWVADPDELLREALTAAADRLTDRFGEEDPGEWRMPARQSEFAPLGGTNPVSVPMTNRASYQQSVAVGQGEGGERDRAKSVLPPANTGHVNLWELLAAQFGHEPDRLTAQVDTYAEFGYTPSPTTRERVEALTVDRTHIE